MEPCVLPEGAWALGVKAGQWAGKECAGGLGPGSTEFESCLRQLSSCGQVLTSPPQSLALLTCKVTCGAQPLQGCHFGGS